MKELPKPSDKPVPPTYVSHEPTYRGSEWRAMCRMKLTDVALRRMQGTSSTRPSAEDVGETFQILPVSVEKEGKAYPLNESLHVGSYLVFTFADECGELFKILKNLVIGPASSSTEDVERMWVPVYKFEVGKNLCEKLHQDLVRRHLGETERHTGHLRFCLRASELRDLGGQQDSQEDHSLLLSQGSWKEFKLCWAQHSFTQCRSTGFKQVYSISPAPGVDLPDPQPFDVIRVVRSDPNSVLFAFENEKPVDRDLKDFVSQLRPGCDLDGVISTKWVPVFNFSVPAQWVPVFGYSVPGAWTSVEDVARDFRVIVCGIHRFHGSGSRAIWFPSRAEKFGQGDEIILLERDARNFVQWRESLDDGELVVNNP